MSDRRLTKITPAARLRCAKHTLADQLAQLREIDRLKIIEESCERIERDARELRRDMPIAGAD